MDLALFSAAELPEATFSHLPLDILLTIFALFAAIDPDLNEVRKVSRRFFYLSIQAIKKEVTRRRGVYLLVDTSVWALPYVLECVRLVTCGGAEFIEWGIPLGVTHLYLHDLNFRVLLMEAERKMPYRGVKALFLTDPTFQWTTRVKDMIMPFRDLLALYVCYVGISNVQHTLPLTSYYFCLMMGASVTQYGSYSWNTFEFTLRNVVWLEIKGLNDAPFDGNWKKCLSCLDCCAMIKYLSIHFKIKEKVDPQQLKDDIIALHRDDIPGTMRVMALLFTGTYTSGEEFTIDESTAYDEHGQVLTEYSYEDAYAEIKREMERRFFQGQVDFKMIEREISYV